MAIYKRPNSKYYWMKFTFDGELIQQSTKVKNKKDADLIERTYRTQLALSKIGIKPRKNAPTFDKAIQNFLEWSKVEHGESSRERYSFCCKPLLKFFGQSKTSDLETKDIENYVHNRSVQTSRKTKQPITRETINRELVVLKSIFRKLDNEGVLDKNPMRDFKRLSENERKFHVINADEQRLYLFACPQPLKDVAVMMLETGMRCGEVYQLKRQDIFIEKGYLKVTKGKTKSSIRQVPLSDKARLILVDRLKRFDGENLFPQNDINGCDATKTLDHFHLKTVRRLGFDFRLYDCRHTFATRAIESGIDLVVLASILGHSSLKMLMRYAHPSENLKAEAIKKMQFAKAV